MICRCGKDVADKFPLPFRCSCGWTIARDGSGYWRDGRDVPPSILAMGVAYIGAWRRWAVAGFPVREADEVTRIRSICGACEHQKNGRCLKCGCKTTGGGWLGDKPRWATEHCPLKEPKW